MDEVATAIVVGVTNIVGAAIARIMRTPVLELAAKSGVKYSLGMTSEVISDAFDYMQKSYIDIANLKSAAYIKGDSQISYENIYRNLSMAIYLEGKGSWPASIEYYLLFYRLGAVRLNSPEFKGERHPQDRRMELAVHMDFFGQMLASRGIIVYP